MFPVACAHCILATKFAQAKMIFCPEHAEDISYVYTVNQIFVSVPDLLAKQISNRIGPSYLWHFFVCVFLPILLIKRLGIAVFLSIK